MEICPNGLIGPSRVQMMALTIGMPTGTKLVPILNALMKECIVVIHLQNPSFVLQVVKYKYKYLALLLIKNTISSVRKLV
jgi:hypothetical protein